MAIGKTGDERETDESNPRDDGKEGEISPIIKYN